MSQPPKILKRKSKGRGPRRYVMALRAMRSGQFAYLVCISLRWPGFVGSSCSLGQYNVLQPRINNALSRDGLLLKMNEHEIVGSNVPPV